MTKKQKHITFFLLVIFISVLPHVQLFPLDVTVTGRWFYVASFGILGFLGVLTKKEWQLILVIPIVCFSLISINRTYDFRNGFALYSHDIKQNENNYNLTNNLGVEYYRLGNKEKSCRFFQESVDLNKLWWTNYNNLGVCKESAGQLDEALILYKKAIDNGQYYLAYLNYANILMKQNKYKDAKEFIIESLKYFPESTNLLEMLQRVQQ